MDKVKKQLLQAAINHGSIRKDVLRELLANLCDAYDVREPESATALNSFIAEIDASIRTYDQTLQIIKHPLNGEEYLVFALLIVNQACKFQPQYTDTERNYFYKLLETLVSSDDYGIEWMDIYRVANLIPANVQRPLSKQRIQDLETIWMSQGYFLEKDEKIYLGPRSMLEYGNYLKKNFPEYIKDCILCNKIVYWDVKCSECDVKLHRQCIRKYLTKKSTCPGCKRTWNTRLSLSQPPN
ncbi:non-structural maintenance of chromosomes element 1 homolog [Stomoxys calcitrans]|uniref:Non-structural maintenance of chromosomes element 1 homolog n=1 Tax=Stomoxys calcitrans TaxID=35570 RepID=A0A1I8PFM2_STOCA|nr:non-structural maintenance of chromosomes element 1 homolog [Stomoxys calcitrans]